MFQDWSNQAGKPDTISNIAELLSIPPGETEAAYFEGLGRFIAAYANAEAGVHALTRALSKLSEEKARVIFAGMRLGDLTSRIRAMARADRMDEATYREIDTCLIQLDHVADARNKLVHREVSYLFGAFNVTNASTARTREGIEFEIFTKTKIDDLASDASSIFFRLLVIARPEIAKIDPPFFAGLLTRPWRYIPAPPAPQQKSPRKAPQSQKPQPRASGA